MGNKLDITWLVLLFIVMLSTLIYLIVLMVKFFKYLSKSRWSTVQGTVTSVTSVPATSSSFSNTKISYTYTMSGTQYTNTTDQVDNSTTYKVGSTVSIKVDPKNPGQSYVAGSETTNKVRDSLIFIVTLIVFLVSTILLVRGLKKYRS